MRIIKFQLCILLFFCCNILHSQTITEAEWWFNDQYSAAQKVGIGNTATGWKYNIPTDLLEQGIHKVNIRVKDNTGRYSAISSSYFFKATGSEILEYWFDNDFENSKKIIVPENGFIKLPITTDELEAGLHILKYRTGFSDGVMGRIHTDYFFKLNTVNGTGAQIFEYWFNDDYDNRLKQSISKSNDLIQLKINTSSLSVGGHQLNYRAGYDGGMPGATSVAFFVKGQNPYAAENAKSLTLSEYSYWFDDIDSTRVTHVFERSASTRNVRILADASDLSISKEHSFNIQFKRSDGATSIVLKEPFRISYEPKIKLLKAHSSSTPNERAAAQFQNLEIGDVLTIAGSSFIPNGRATLQFQNGEKIYAVETTIDSEGKFTYDYATALVDAGVVQVVAIDNTTGVMTHRREFKIMPKDLRGREISIEPFITTSLVKGNSYTLQFRNAIPLFEKKNIFINTPLKQYSYKIEYQTAPNGQWTQLGENIESYAQWDSPSDNVVFSFTPPVASDYFRIKITDNNGLDNFKMTEVAHVIENSNRLKTTLEWDCSYDRPLGILNPIGVAADGVARIYVKVRPNNPDDEIQSIDARIGENYMNVAPNFYGKLYPASNNEDYNEEANNANSTAIFDVQANKKEVLFWYVAPEDFEEQLNGQYANESERIVQIFIEAKMGDGTILKETKDIKIVRPPLLLVHGLASSSSAWDDFGYGSSYYKRRFVEESNPLYKTGLEQVKAIQLSPSDYFVENATRLLDKDNKNSIQARILAVRNKGYASNQVDYVCHSMGGCVLRTAITSQDTKNLFYQTGKYASNYPFKTYGKGYVHKAITINTPHNGSPLADLLADMGELSKTDYIMKLRLNIYNRTPKIQDMIQDMISFTVKDGVYYYQATPAINNLQVMGDGAYFLPDTHVRHHLIAGDINIDSRNPFSLTTFLEDETNQQANESRHFIAEMAMAAGLLLAAPITWGFEDVVREIEDYSEILGIPQFFENGDGVVSLASQMAVPETPVPTSSSYKTIFYSQGQSINANHLQIVSRYDVGNQVKDLLNMRLQGNLFSDTIKANPRKMGGLRAKSEADVTTHETVFDRTHIEIIAPSSNELFRVGAQIPLTYQLHKQEHLDHVVYLLGSEYGTITNSEQTETIRLSVTPDLLGEQTIQVVGVYKEGNKTTYHVDTVSIHIITDEILMGFRTSPEIVDLYVNERHYANFIASYEYFDSKVTAATGKLSVFIGNPEILQFDYDLNRFSGIASGVTYAEIEYDGMRDTMYFNVLNKLNILEEDDDTSIENIQAGNSTLLKNVFVYPNPVSDNVNIEYTLSKTSDVIVELFNTTGQAIKSWNLGKQEIGKHTFSENIAGLSRGFYIIKIKSKTEEWTGKIIKN